MKRSRLKKASTIEDLNRLALNAIDETVMVNLSSSEVFYGILNTVIYREDGSIDLEFSDGQVINSNRIYTFSTDEGVYVNINHSEINPYDDLNIWNTP